MKISLALKIIAFIEFLTFFVTICCHFICYLTEQEFPLSIYWIMPLIAMADSIIAILFIIIFTPLIEWWFSL